MSTTAWTILVGYTVLALVGVVVVLFIYRSTRVGFRAEPAERDTVEKRETGWALLVGLFLLTVLALTIFQVPYFFNSEAKGTQQLKIVGQQYAWSFAPTRVKAGVPTVVTAHAKDVSHALGIYNPNGTLVKQVNVLPKADQKFKITFEKVGTYKIRCLEFCGLDHHKMQTDLEVTR